uniref:laccase n=1 Tax=Coriolopsis trogii TaxID=76130 RepID=A0A140CWW5_9APHY|nr:laccase 4 [Coriolopsis trogii]
MADFRFLHALVVLSFGVLSFAAIGPVTDLEITNKNISPDGYERAAVLAGGTFPGALITGKKGDHFQINVVDDLTNHTMLKSTSIHWHGFFQKGTNWADGPAFINQCPISPGNSFLYDFNVPDQAGTFWYHSHLSTQYCDGLRGPIVVYDPNDPHASRYDVDNDDTVITLADWYHVAARLGPAIPFAGADSTLINGKGRSLGNLDAELSVITVTKGKRYRFRLVSISCDPNYVFSIDGHDLTVIEADSVNTEPLVVDSIQIFAGQRYSFVLEANKDSDNYWIRANPNFGVTGFDGGINSAILRYDDAAPVEPTTTSTSTKPLKETDLRPLTAMPVPGEAKAGGVDKAINFAFSFNGSNFFINGATFAPPAVPVLLQIMSGAQDPSDLLPSGDIYSLPSNAIIELSFPATVGAPGAPHPFHLHGHTFAVVRSAGSSEYNYDNPIWRDVVNTGTPADGDNVTIRFRTDNPGPWFLHCHIDFHLEAGFAVVMAEDIPNTKSANPPSQAWEDLCPTYNALPVSDQ